MDQKIPKNPIRFGLFISKSYKKWMIGAFACVFFATVISQLYVIILQYLTNALIKKPLDMHTIVFWATILVLNFFVAQIFWRVSGFTGMRWIMGMRYSIYQTLYEYLSLHSKDYFDDRFAGALTNKISNAVDGIDYLTSQILWQFTQLIVGLTVYVIFAWSGNPLLGIILFFWSLIFILINIWFAKKLQPRSIRSADALSTLKGRIVDSLGNISLVHEYANLFGERKYIKNFMKRSYNAGTAQWYLSEWMLFVNGILLFIFMCFMLGISLSLFQKNSITVGVIVMIITIVGLLINQLFFLGQQLRDAAKYYGQTKEGLEEILTEHRIVDAPNAKDFHFSKGDIDLQTINFAYENSTVFKNFSISVPAGQKVGLVGRSGAGKTTFVSLLLRHFDIQEGNIMIDGQDIQEITLESLRRGIAFVPQDTSLFHRTIRENICYGNPEATFEEIKHSAALAQADNFIQKLPKKYETLVGERGVKLSGGQRQRIAIARAFLKNAPILILDEATSSLDSESEHAIQQSLDKLMQGRTVIAIAHRLSTLKKMNRIVVIENGKIVEDGDPNELLKHPASIFKSMWNHQVRGFILDE
jgi:ATP-binding cassette, subfamily B, bacterial